MLHFLHSKQRGSTRSDVTKTVTVLFCLYLVIRDSIQCNCNGFYLITRRHATRCKCMTSFRRHATRLPGRIYESSRLRNGKERKKNFKRKRSEPKVGAERDSAFVPSTRTFLRRDDESRERTKFAPSTIFQIVRPRHSDEVNNRARNFEVRTLN